MRMVKPLARLHEQLRRLPGIGSKSALRLAYHVLDMKREDVEELARALLDVKDRVHLCRQCFDLCEGELCEICQDEKGTGAWCVWWNSPRMWRPWNGPGATRVCIMCSMGSSLPWTGWGRIS